MRTRFLIVILFFVATLANMNGLALYPFLPSIADEFGLSVSVVGQAMTISLLGGAIIGLVAGPLADHYGQRRFIILGTLLMAVSGMGTALAGNYEVLLVARFPAGVASGILMGIGLSLATTRLAGRERRSAVGWIASGSALGAVIGPPLMTTLAELGTWRTGFWILAFAPVPLALISIRVIAADQTHPTTTFRLLKTISDYRSVFSDRRSLLLQGGMLLWAIPTVAGSGYLGAYLIQVHDFSVPGVGLGYMWAAAWLMAGPRVGIWLLNYFELYTVLIISGLMMAATTMTLFWLPLGLPWILLVMMVWTIAMGSGTPLMTSAISEATRAGQSTAMMARQFNWTVGGAAGVAIGGIVIAAGGYSLFGFVSGGCALVFVAVVHAAASPVPAEPMGSPEMAAGE